MGCIMDSILPLAEFLLGAGATVCGGSFWLIQQRVSAGKKDYAIKRDFEELRLSTASVRNKIDEFEGDMSHRMRDLQRSLDSMLREIDSRFDSLDREIIELRATVNTSIITSCWEARVDPVGRKSAETPRRQKTHLVAHQEKAPQDWEARRLSESDFV